MAGLPNAKNYELLENMCLEHTLSDPIRSPYPNKRDFTYSPFGNVRLNRSLLDIFVVSSNLLELVADCNIDSAPKCKLFDHKCVTLTLFRNQTTYSKQNCLSNTFCNGRPYISRLCLRSALRTYIQ
jgi:hypothetical protein